MGKHSAYIESLIDVIDNKKDTHVDIGYGNFQSHFSRTENLIKFCWDKRYSFQITNPNTTSVEVRVMKAESLLELYKLVYHYFNVHSLSIDVLPGTVLDLTRMSESILVEQSNFEGFGLEPHVFRSDSMSFRSVMTKHDFSTFPSKSLQLEIPLLKKWGRDNNVAPIVSPNNKVMLLPEAMSLKVKGVSLDLSILRLVQLLYETISLNCPMAFAISENTVSKEKIVPGSIFNKVKAITESLSLDRCQVNGFDGYLIFTEKFHSFFDEFGKGENSLRLGVALPQIDYSEYLRNLEDDGS